MATGLVTSDYQQQLTHRARSTPLVAGAPGNRFDLTLSTLYFRGTELGTVPLSARDELSGRSDGRGVPEQPSGTTTGTAATSGPGNTQGSGPGVLRAATLDRTLALAIPVHQRFSARGAPLVGVGFEYFGFRDLRAARGTLPRTLGDVVLGSELAAVLGLAPGDTLYSDPREVYDIARPAALALSVCGVLGVTDSPDDKVAFVDIATSQLLEGLLHGHADAATAVDDSLVMARSDKVVMVSPALVEDNAVTVDNAADFHAHGDLGALPLTAFIIVPRDDKAATMLSTRVNARGRWQIVAPTDVISDLMGFVFRIKTLFDTMAALLIFSTTLLVGLVLVLSMGLRAGEMTTLRQIGCSPGMVARLHALEACAVVILGAVVAALLVALTVSWLPGLMTVLA